MSSYFVLTLAGPDQIGIVDTVTRLLLARGGNVEMSRMARLGGEFAILMLVSMPAEQRSGLDRDLEGLSAQGYQVTITQSEQTHAEAYRGWSPYRIEVHGADHQGIIQEVAHYLSQHGINIESMDSETTPAPISGIPLFAMTAQIVVSPSLSGQGWEVGLEDLASRMNLEIRLFPVNDR
jgi:glycine cleavage system transcriptional repressor